MKGKARFNMQSPLEILENIPITKNRYVDRLIINEKPILFVPKRLYLLRINTRHKNINNILC